MGHHLSLFLYFSLHLSLSPFPLFISHLILKYLNIETKYCVKNSHLRDICPLTESLPWKFYTSFVSKVTLNTRSEAGCAILYFRKHYFLTNQYFSYNLWKFLLISTTCNILILWDEWKSCQYFDGYCLFWITVLSHVNTRLYFKELFVKSVFSRWLFEWMTTERVLSSPQQDNLVSETIRNFKQK